MVDGTGQPAKEQVASPPPVPFRQRLRADVLRAIAGGDQFAAQMLGEYLARLTPASADDLVVSAAARACRGDAEGSRQLLQRALSLDPYHLVAAKGLLVRGLVTEDVVKALCWHAETDMAAARLLVEQVRRDGQPLTYVAGRMIHSILPATAQRLTLIWRGLVLADQTFAPGDDVRVVAVTVPQPLRGIVDPVVMLDGRPVGLPIDAVMLRPPRLISLVERLEDGNWQARVMDAAAPARPVSVLLLDGDRLISRHVSIPPEGKAISDLLNAPILPLAVPDAISTPRLLFELTGEPLERPKDHLPAPMGEIDGVIDVVVPVYGDEEATRKCFEALLGVDPGAPMRVVAIDDAGPSPALGSFLLSLAGQGQVTLRRNPGNLGFVRSVNIGMAISSRRDVVLLNADTIVSAGWLGRLRAAAYQAPDIGTATPWSNDATICSYPAGNDRTPLDQIDPAALDVLARETLSGRISVIPTAVGFCMYIKRECLSQIGWFDAIAFGAGYGEENDFCLRATEAGWRHVLAQDIYVGHVGGGSFGPEKQARIDKALAVIEQRYPGYEAEIHRFIARDPLAEARRRLDMARVLRDGRIFPLLLVCAQLGGGTDRFVASVVARAATAGTATLILRPEHPEDGATRLRLEIPDRSDISNLVYDPVDGLGDLYADLLRLGVGRMEIHHPFYLDAAALSHLSSWFPYRVHLHDYSWVCPRITMTRSDGRYCGEPDVAACENCVAEHGDLLGIGTSVGEWRLATRVVMEGAEAVDCATHDSAARITRYVPAARTLVKPLERSLQVDDLWPFAAPRRAEETLRVAIPGAIGLPKGFATVLACAEDAAARGLALRFVIMGYTLDDGALLDTGYVQIVGPYEDTEVPGLLAALAPHVGLLPSTWPETWCYALTHLLEAGLPIAAFNLGAQAERLQMRGNGVLMPLTMTASDINDALVALAATRQ